MRRRDVLGILIAGSGAAIGCRSLRVDGGLYRPAELTATAVAAVPTVAPTPTPQLGQVAYVNGGDIWVKELPDGAARRLTQDGRNSTPRWSLSGAWLAYRKDQMLWVSRTTGAEAKPLFTLTTALDFTWSPLVGHAERLAGMSDLGLVTVAPAYQDPGSHQLDLRHLASTQAADAGLAIGGFAWSPDGSWLAFERLEQAPRAAPRSQGVWCVRADTSSLPPTMVPITLSPDPARLQYQLAGWAPDGQTILAWERVKTSVAEQLDGSPLLAIPVAGGAPTRITDAMLAHPDFLAWSPNGQQLLVVDGGGRETWKNKAIAVWESGRLTKISAADQADLFPSLAPDGRSVVFSGAPALLPVVAGGDEDRAIAARRIWRMAVDGSGERQLTKNGNARDECPRWSRDGAYLLFTRIQNGQGQLWLMRADGTEQKQIVDALTPRPDWFGRFGYVDWDQLYDWWPGPPATAAPSVSAPTIVAMPPSPSPTVAPTPSDPDLVGWRIAFAGVDDVRYHYPGQSTLWLLVPDTNRPVKLAEREDIALRPAAWSSDAKRLFIVQGEGMLSELDLATGGQKLLSGEFGPWSIGSVFPSPDGKQLALTVGGGNGSVMTHLMPASGGNPVKLPVESDALLGWESGGERRLRFLQGHQIVLYDLVSKQTSVERTLPDSLGQSFVLSPDGSQAVDLVFPEKDETVSVRRSDLILVDLATGARNNLTNGFVYNVGITRWSPDAQWIAFTTSPAWTDNTKPRPRRDLWVMRADGSAKLNLTRGQFDSAGEPIWAPNLSATKGQP